VGVVQPVGERLRVAVGEHLQQRGTGLQQEDPFTRQRRALQGNETVAPPRRSCSSLSVEDTCGGFATSAPLAATMAKRCTTLGDSMPSRPTCSTAAGPNKKSRPATAKVPATATVLADNRPCVDAAAIECAPGIAVQ